MSTPTLPPTPIAAPVPSGDGAAEPDFPGSIAHMDRQLAELRELEKQYPPLERNARVADTLWLNDHWLTDTIIPYRGTHVAVFNGAVVGSGDDWLQLQIDLSRRYNVHPERIIVEFIPPPGWRI